MTKELLFLDFESYFSTQTGFDLKSISMVEYIRSPEFKSFGFAWVGPKGEPVWITGSRAQEWFDSIDHWQDIAVVGHNIKFDGFILKEIYGVKAGQYIDTKGMSRAVLGKTIKDHSLATLAGHFGLEAKGTMKTNGLKELTAEQEAELASYCVHDVRLCREIFNRLAVKFPENQYKYMDQTIKMFVNPKLVLNVPLLEEASYEEKTRRESIFKEIGIEKELFASNKKFPELLRQRGFVVPTKQSPRTGKEIPALALGDTGFLELKENGDEVLKKLCEARVAAKSTLLETRSGKLAVIGRTGPWSFDVEFSGADQTHRFSGGSGAGGNPQNFTRDSALREAVEAPFGYKLVAGDFSQVEFRLVAFLSQDPGLMDLVARDVDFYCEYASIYYGRRITKEDVLERKFGKECLLALGYNMGSKKFKTRLKINTGMDLTDAEAWKAVNFYRTKYARVPKLWETLGQFIGPMADKGTCISPPNIPVTFVHEGFLLPSGLKVQFPNLRQEPGEKDRMEWVYDVWDKRRLEKRRLYGGKLLENISQALAGELCKEAMGKLGDYVTGQVHDELHIVVPDDEVELAAETLEHVMSSSPKWMPQLRLAAEIGYGQNWRTAK